MTVRILTVINLLLSVTLGAQGNVYLRSSISYGTVVDSIINIANTDKCSTPSPYVLRQYQTLVDSLKASTYWNDIQNLYCFEHDGPQCFSKYNIRTGGADTLSPQGIGSYILKSNNISQLTNIDLNREGMRLVTTNASHFFNTLASFNKLDFTLGLILSRITTEDSDGALIVGGDVAQTFPNYGTILKTGNTAPSTPGFKGVVYNNNTDTTAMMVTNTINYTNTVPISISRLNSTQTVMSIANSQGNLYSYSAHATAILDGFVFYNVTGQQDNFNKQYTGQRRIKFAYIGNSNVLVNKLQLYFDTYSRNIPNIN